MENSFYSTTIIFLGKMTTNLLLWIVFPNLVVSLAAAVSCIEISNQFLVLVLSLNIKDKNEQLSLDIHEVMRFLQFI